MVEQGKTKESDKEFEQEPHPVHRLLSELELGPKTPGRIEWEVHIIPRVFLIHPITGDKIELRPRGSRVTAEAQRNDAAAPRAEVRRGPAEPIGERES